MSTLFDWRELLTNHLVSIWFSSRPYNVVSSLVFHVYTSLQRNSCLPMSPWQLCRCSIGTKVISSMLQFHNFFTKIWGAFAVNFNLLLFCYKVANQVYFLCLIYFFHYYLDCFLFLSSPERATRMCLIGRLETSCCCSLWDPIYRISSCFWFYPAPLGYRNTVS